MMTRSSARALAWCALSLPLFCSCNPTDSSLPPEAGGRGNVAGTGGNSPVAGSGGTQVTQGGSGGTPSAGSCGSAGSLVVGGSGGIGVGGMSTGGSGGVAPTGGSGGNAPLAGFGPAPVDKPDTVEIGVRNNCPFSLWIHGDGNGGTLAPDDQELKTGGIAWYDAPKAWSAARVTAFIDGPRKTELDKVEMTLDNNAASGEVLNYNVTYVDWLGLPVEIASRGGGGDCKTVGCYVKEADVLQGCPSGLLAGKQCVSPRSYCLNPSNQATPLCNSLNDEVKKCAQKPGCEGAASATTADAFACAGFFGGTPKWCAALNRHMQDAPDSTDKSQYYSANPYNTYAKWVHQVCPGIYAFPYDDYPSTIGESGFHSCTQGQELEITFCPAG